MKGARVAVLLATALLTAQAFAQETSLDSYLELMRSDIRTEKKAIVERVMNFSESEAAKFWPFYREYELEVSKLGDRRIAAMKDYALHYEKMGDKKADELVNESFRLQEKRSELMLKWYTKASKILGLKRAAQWIQVENQISALIDAKIASETPLLK